MQRLQLNSMKFLSTPRGHDDGLRAFVGKSWPAANLIKKVQARNFLNFPLARGTLHRRQKSIFVLSSNDSTPGRRAFTFIC